MAITSNHVNSTTVSPGYGAVPAPLTTGQVYTTISTGASNLKIANQIDQVLTVRPANNSCPTIEVKGNMVINGVDLEERLKTIEQVLTIPERDVKLEKKHPKLKKLYDEYIHTLAKYRTFEAIKGDDNETT
jgi:hypothetical protein